MPNYTVKDSQTGKTVTFAWNGEAPPTDADMAEVFAAAKAPAQDFETQRRQFVQAEGTPSTVNRLAPVEMASHATPQAVPMGKPVSTLDFGTPRQLEEAAAIKKQMESPTAPPKSLADFATRVIPESAAKVAMGAYKLPAVIAGDIVAPAAGGDIGTAVSNAGDVGMGVVNAITRPIGLQGFEKAKEAWTTDPVGSGLSLLGVKPTLQAFRKVGTAAADVGAGLLGTYTGTSKNMIKQAAGAGPDFTQAMRGGEEGGAAIVQKAKDALQQIREERGNAYREQLDQIAQNAEPIADAPQVLQQKLTDQMQKFGVKQAADGSADFSRSTLNRKAQGDVAEIIDTINSWGKQPGDLTPLGLDTLKRQLDDFYSDSKNSRALVSSLRDSVKNLIVEKVPEYADMTKSYAEATGLINELDRTLSLGKKPMIDTTLRKLTQSMRDNFQFRKELLDTLSGMTGENLQDMVAGYNMSSWAPQGGFGKLTAGGIGLGTFTQALSPAYLSALLMASPRVVGESLRALGLTSKGASKVYSKFPAIKEGLAKLPTGAKAMAGAAADSQQHKNDPLGIRQ